MAGTGWDDRISARLERRIAARVAHRATGQRDETTVGGLARRAANRMDATTTRLVANALDMFGADDKAADFRTIAQGTEDELPDARTVAGKAASVVGYVAPQAMVTVLGARGLSAAGGAANAAGMARTARAVEMLAGGKGAGVLRRNVGGAVAAAPLITVPGALSDDPRASTVGNLAEALPESSVLGKAARTIASTKVGRLAADLGVDVLAGSALEGVGRGVGAAARGAGRAAARGLDVSEGMVEAGAKAAGEEVEDAARVQGRSFAQASDAEKAAKVAADVETENARVRADALAKLDETKLAARRAGMDRHALKAKPKALLPPSPDEASRYDIETYRLNRDRNADIRAKVRANWEAGQERTAIVEEAPPLDELTARTPGGRLPQNLTKVETDALGAELLALHEANSADEGLAQGAVRLSGSLNYADDPSSGPMLGDVGVHPTDASMKASGRIAARKQAIARVEAELQSRGVKPSDALWMASSGETADGATSFDFGANITPEVAAPARPKVTAEDMLEVGKRRAADLGFERGAPPNLMPAMEREGRMFGDLPSRGTMFDVGGAVGTAARTRFGSSAVMGATGAAMQESDDEKIKATGTGLMALAAIHAVGLPRIKAGGQFVGKAAVEQMRQSPFGVKVLNGISHDILADPKVKVLFDAYQDAVSKGRARAAELSKAAKALGPEGDRQVSDLIEHERFEPLTGDQAAVLAVAQRISDEFTALGRGKVSEGLLSPETVAKREGMYLPRMYAEHLGETANKAQPDFLKGTTGNKPRIIGDRQRQDLSVELRNRLGEVREASFRTAYGLDKGARDIAAAKLFSGLREMPGVVHPDFATAADALLAARRSGDVRAVSQAKQALEGVAKLAERESAGFTRLADTPGMGILRGAVVRNDVAAYLNGIPAWGGKMGDLYSLWKRMHTVMNPGTHVGNTMSNSVVAHMSGLPVWQQPAALKRALWDYNGYGPTTRYLAELGILERGLPTIADAVPIGGRKLSTALSELSETTRPETRRVLKDQGIAPRGKVRKGWDWASQKMERAYSKEDGVFRVATFDRLVAGGMDRRAAAEYVDHAFVNYQTRSPLLGVIKNTVSPFILYPVKAIPFVAGQIVEHPWRWATLAAAWGAMDQFSQKQVGTIAQEDLRPDQRTNKGLGYLVPGFTQLPFKNERGDRYGLDVARWTPFSALTGAPAPGSVAMAMGGSDVPAVLQPSGPFLDIGARVTNTDPYTGGKLIKPGDDMLDKAMAVVKSGAALAAPSALSFHLPRVARDIQNADPRAAAVDALGFVGGRPSVVRPGAQRTRELREYNAARANIIGDLRYELRQAKSPARRRELEDRARAKLQHLAERLQGPTAVSQAVP